MNEILRYNSGQNKNKPPGPIFVLITLIVLLSAPSVYAANAKRRVKQGNILYNKGDYPEALKRYEDAFTSEPESDIVNYNLGNALYKNEDYQQSIKHFEKALLSEDQQLQQKASYNAGNAKYKFGISKEEEELQATINLLKQSLSHYQRAIELDADDQDAQFNYEFVQKELARLEKKPPQPQQQQNENKQDKQEQQKQQQSQQEKEEQDQQSEQQQKQQQEQEQSGTQNQGQRQQGQQNELSEEEALMLLESYRQEEEPKGLYREKMKGQPQKVLKDW